MQRKEIEERLILAGVVGSTAYGLNRPDSDIDVKGICIGNKSLYFGYKVFEVKDHGWDTEKGKYDFLNGKDTSVYELRKILRLIAGNNPNAVELLWLDNYLHVTPIAERLIAERDNFLSKKIKHTLTGYSWSQIKRMETHRKWLLEPPTAPPKMEDYGFDEEFKPMTKSETNAFLEFLYICVRDCIEYLQPCEEVRKLMLEDLDYKGIFQQHLLPEEVDRAVMQYTRCSKDFLHLLHQTQTYRVALRHWEAYQSWRANRNPARAALEAKCGYDCYSADTEFLTEDGWKFFDEITDQPLATVYVGEDMTIRKWGRIEYQDPVDKFSGLFSGNLYHFEGNDLDILVTPNHNMYYNPPIHKDGIVDKYLGWRLGEASTMPAKNLQMLRSVTPWRATRFKLQDNFEGIPISHKDYLALMGWYLSDGTMAFRRDDPKAVVISQREGGRLYKSMVNFQNTYPEFSSIYSYVRKPNEFNSGYCTEVILSIRDRSIIDKLYSDCSRTKTKHIPRWVLDLPKNYQEFLVEGLMLGDGFVKKDPEHGEVYYTNSKLLANDVQELLFKCGWHVKIYGPYQYKRDDYLPMYQVVFNRLHGQETIYNKANNLTLIPVKDHRIVCFTVPNGVLVTRRGGKIAIQGNSKNASHAIRLLEMGREILTEGVVIVNRKKTSGWADLMAIRNGDKSYEYVMARAQDLQDEMEGLYKTTTLRNEVSNEYLNNLCVELVEEYGW